MRFLSLNQLQVSNRSTAAAASALTARTFSRFEYAFCNKTERFPYTSLSVHKGCVPSKPVMHSHQIALLCALVSLGSTPMVASGQVVGPSLSISGPGIVSGQFSVGDSNGGTFTLGINSTPAATYQQTVVMDWPGVRHDHRLNLGGEFAGMFTWGLGDAPYNNNEEVMSLYMPADAYASMYINAELAVEYAIWASEIYVAGSPVVTASMLQSYYQNIIFNSVADRSISVATSPTGNGKDLSIIAGSAQASNQAGGDIVISAGNSRGSAGSTIELKTAVGGSGGTTANVASTRLRIDSTGGIAAGDNLSTFSWPQFITGRYNDTRTSDDSGTDHTVGYFIVGSGSGVTNNPNFPERQNAIRVTPEGVVLILEKGDLSMGAFKAGPTP